MEPGKMFNFLEDKVPDAIVIELRGGGTMDVLGTSMPTNLPPSPRGISSLNVFPIHGANGMVAVVVSQGKEKNPFMVEINRLPGGITPPFASRGTQWNPSPERLGGIIQLGGAYHLVALYGDIWYTTSKSAPGMRFVSDANLICRYLVGTATPEELHTASVENRTLRDQVGEGLETAAGKFEDGFEKLTDRIGAHMDSVMAEAQGMNKKARQHLASLFSHLAEILKPDKPKTPDQPEVPKGPPADDAPDSFGLLSGGDWPKGGLDEILDHKKSGPAKKPGAKQPKKKK